MKYEHSIVSAWTDENTNFRPAQLSPGGPLVIQCDVPTYGVRRWSLLIQGCGRDKERTKQLKQDVQIALREMFKEEREP